MTQKLRISVFLMLLSILVIIVFQGFWLKKNYQDEQRLFNIRTGVLFRETVIRLQASKLHLDSSSHFRVQQKMGALSLTRILQDKITSPDSLRGQIRIISDSGREPRREMLVTVNHDLRYFRNDSGIRYTNRHSGPSEKILDFLVGVDSLRDSLSSREIVDQFSQVLAKEKIRVPFWITRRDSLLLPLPGAAFEPPDDNMVTVGFVRPVTYQLNFGNTRWYLLGRMGQPLVISLLLVGVIVASFLIMYRNLLQQRKLTQLKNEFISNITHELKTPIATVSVAIEAMKSFNALQDPARTREYLDISGNELQRLSLLVDKVLKLSMFEKQQVDINKENFDLKVLVDEVVSSMRLQFENYHAQVSFETEGSDFQGKADRLHLTSVIYNLLDNALKYSRENPVIRIQLKRKAAEMELSVTDNGIGIPAAYRDKVFEKFFRVPSGDRHNVKGYGLGLSYVAFVISRHQGSLQVESQEGIGSRFTFTLPLSDQ